MGSGRLVLVALLLGAPGCTYLHYAGRNLLAEPVNYVQECHFRERVRRQARAAWQEIASAKHKEYSSAYAHGFEDGFVEYVDANGTGLPPAMPPPKYRRELQRNPGAQQKIVDWYDGFRHGAAEAMRLGLRETAVIPLGLPPRVTNDQTQQQFSVPPPTPIDDLKLPVPEVLPVPKKDESVENLPALRIPPG